MQKHEIDLNSFLPKGQVVTAIKDNMLYMTTTSAIPTARFEKDLSINSYIALPNPYKLPLRIDVTVKIDSPGLYLLLGNGHINFGTPWSDNRRFDDICEPQRKTKFFHNYIKMNEYVDISLIYDLKEMQILVNGEERYYSTKEKYMKSALFSKMNTSGFIFRIACDKRIDLYIKSVCITEYDETAGIVCSEGEMPAAISANDAILHGEKPTFETCISSLPKDIIKEIINTDAWLRKLTPMKFKRQLEKHGNKITYIASDYGFSYAIYPSNDVMYHTLQWYIITSSKPEFWHRKADRMEDTLDWLVKTNPEFAQRMFFNLDDCIGCGSNCAVKTLYKFAGKQNIACHGKMRFKMCISDFEDVRAFISSVNDLNAENRLISDHI